MFCPKFVQGPPLPENPLRRKKENKEHENYGYIHNTQDSFCAGTKMLLDRASFHT